jgi:hypothetical protein
MSMEISRSEYRWVQFGKQNQIEDFLTKQIRGEFTPRAKEILQNVIHTIALTFDRRNVFARKSWHGVSEIPALPDGLEKHITKLVEKGCLKATERQEKEDQEIYKNVSMGLRFYMKGLPSFVFSRKEKQQATISTSSSQSSSSSLSSTLASSTTPINEQNDDVEFWSAYKATKTLPYPTTQYVSKLAETNVSPDHPQLREKIPYGYHIKNGILCAITEEDVREELAKENS